MILTEITAAQARPWLAKAQEFDVSLGVVSQAENESGCSFLGAYDDAGEFLGAFSLRLAGNTLWIVQAGAVTPGAFLFADMSPLLDQIAAQFGVKSIAFATQHQGLAHKSESLGFIQAGILMRKVLP